MQGLLGMQRMPPGDNDFPVMAENFIILQKHTFLGNDTFSVESDIFHMTVLADALVIYVSVYGFDSELICLTV